MSFFCHVPRFESEVVPSVYLVLTKSYRLDMKSDATLKIHVSNTHGGMQASASKPLIPIEKAFLFAKLASLLFKQKLLCGKDTAGKGNTTQQNTMLSMSVTICNKSKASILKEVSPDGCSLHEGRSHISYVQPFWAGRHGHTGSQCVCLFRPDRTHVPLLRKPLVLTGLVHGHAQLTPLHRGQWRPEIGYLIQPSPRTQQKRQLLMTAA